MLKMEFCDSRCITLMIFSSVYNISKIFFLDLSLNWLHFIIMGVVFLQISMIESNYYTYLSTGEVRRI